MSMNTLKIELYASNHKPIYKEQDDNLEEFIKLIGANPELKLFQHNSSSVFDPDFIQAKQPLSYFRDIQESYELFVISPQPQHMSQGSLKRHTSYVQSRPFLFEVCYPYQRAGQSSSESHVYQSFKKCNYTSFEYTKPEFVTDQLSSSTLCISPLFASKKTPVHDDDDDSLLFEMSEYEDDAPEINNENTPTGHINQLKRSRPYEKSF